VYSIGLIRHIFFKKNKFIQITNIQIHKSKHINSNLNDVVDQSHMSSQYKSTHINKT
jgi:hypothetical protein